jgi:Cu+-exporting ATPase
MPQADLDTPIAPTAETAPECYHCGDSCATTHIQAEGHSFCCEGCKQVYLLLEENNLCTYYDLDKNPGLKAKGRFSDNRYAYLDNPDIIRQLVQFSSDTQTNVTFSLPQMHCSSCVYLLENLHRINPAIVDSQTNFQRKEVFVRFDPQSISLREVVELLAFIGYEPYISLSNSETNSQPRFNRRRIYQIGVAGFAFSNIMMLSFPEYFSAGNIGIEGLQAVFVWLNVILSLPVLLYSAQDFFISSWKSIRQRYLNIDLPITIAIVVTYGRSYYEILTGTGAGYLDSGTGIVFFMLVGRWFQDKTYDSFSFERDYKAYFPLGVTRITAHGEEAIPIAQLVKGDRILVRHEEMIPADAILMQGDGRVDYSFVSGENTPIEKKKGELIYAGGKQLGAAIELEVVNDVSQSYITKLWNNEVFHGKKNVEKSFIHPWSKYFTYALFTVAIGASIYWWIVNPTNIWPTVTAVLIVACPCSLLLSATFTYGNMLRILGRNKLYLKNASVLEAMGNVNLLVLDKTGTLTDASKQELHYEGTPLSASELRAVQAVCRQSGHPLSKIIATQLADKVEGTLPTIEAYREIQGQGIEARTGAYHLRLGASSFMHANLPPLLSDSGTNVHVMINQTLMGKFRITNDYRNGVDGLASRLPGYEIALLSGDNDTERKNLEQLLGKDIPLLFRQTPQDKLEFIRKAQDQVGKKVLMLGDGLNDAGALMQSQVGIAVSDQQAQFSPASDAILNGTEVGKLDRFLRYARAAKPIVTGSFMLSILYNIVGLSFAASAQLTPVVAAILMPASSISIVLFVTLVSSMVAKKCGL